MVSETRAMVRINWFSWKSLCVSIAAVDADVFGWVVALEAEVEGGAGVAEIVVVEEDEWEDGGEKVEGEALEG